MALKHYCRLSEYYHRKIFFFFYLENWIEFSWKYCLQQELSDVQKSLKNTRQMRDMALAKRDKIKTELSKVWHICDAFFSSNMPFLQCDACETPVWSQYLWLWCFRCHHAKVYSKFPWKYFWGPTALVSWKGLILKLLFLNWRLLMCAALLLRRRQRSANSRQRWKKHK